MTSIHWNKNYFSILMLFIFNKTTRELLQIIFHVLQIEKQVWTKDLNIYFKKLYSWKYAKHWGLDLETKKYFEIKKPKGGHYDRDIHCCHLT